MGRFSPGLSALSAVIEGCKFPSEGGLTQEPAARKRGSSAINEVRALFLRGPGGGGEKDLFHQSFLSPR